MLANKYTPVPKGSGEEYLEEGISKLNLKTELYNWNNEENKE